MTLRRGSFLEFVVKSVILRVSRFPLSQGEGEAEAGRMEERRVHSDLPSGTKETMLPSGGALLKHAFPLGCTENDGKNRTSSPAEDVRILTWY